jgi:outer membrane protein assembly factor BamB
MSPLSESEAVARRGMRGRRLGRLALAAAVAATAGVIYTAARGDLPEPPFKTLWRVETKGWIGQFLVAGDAVCFTTSGSCGAVDLTTGKPLWEVSMPPERAGAGLAYDGDTLYVAIGGGKLFACDPKTGKESWSLPIKGRVTTIAVRKGLLFCGLDGSVLTALDVETRKPLWTLDLTPESAPTAPARGRVGPPSPIILGDRLFVASGAGHVLRVDPEGGKVRWRYPDADEGRVWPSAWAADDDRLYLTTMPGAVVALDIATGRRRWQSESGGYGLAAADGVVVTSGMRGTLDAIGGDTGESRWRRPLPSPEPSESDPAPEYGMTFPTAEDGRYLIGLGSTVFAFDASGQRLWEWDTEEALGHHAPLSVKRGLLVAGQSSLRRLVEGRPPDLPATAAGRRALADKLVVRFDKLSRRDRGVFRRLGDEAFDALLPLVRKRMGRLDALAAKGESASDEAEAALWQAGPAAELLSRVAGPARMADLAALLGEAKTAESQGIVLWALTSTASEQDLVPLYIETLRKQGRDWEQAEPVTEVALPALARSGDPRAVQFLSEQLADPKANPKVRQEAFVNLARVGGEAGLAAVLAAKDQRRKIPPLPEVLKLERLPVTPCPESERRWQERWSRQPLATKRDARGILWGLIAHGALGDGGDLWVLEHDGKQWTAPLFTGITRKQLGDADWFAKLVADPAYSRDADGDGWTDVVERRLGTDPERADSDGDGLKDSEDKNPLAAPRELNEVEQILAAAFEARFRFIDKQSVPCLVRLPEGVAPLEMAGWDWVIIPQKAGEELPLAKAVGKGVAAIDFRLPYRREWTDAAPPGQREFVVWNEDRTEASLEVSVFYTGLGASGYDIRLRKLDGQWVVVAAMKTWVS